MKKRNSHHAAHSQASSGLSPELILLGTLDDGVGDGLAGVVLHLREGSREFEVKFLFIV